MENFLSNFANTNTEVTSSNANISVSPEFFGTIDINKGGLKMKVSFYARLYKTSFENYISLDDWDINDTSDISFCGVPIDDLHALKTTMLNSGLRTVAEGLSIVEEDYSKEISIQIEKHDMFKFIFGKKARMFTSLSKEEKQKVKLKYVIDNYGQMSLGNTYVQEFLITDDEGNKTIPTIEELTNQLNK